MTDIRDGGRNDLAAGRQFERAHRDVDGRGAAGAGDAIPPPVHAREFPLEIEDLLAEKIEEEIGIDDLVEKLLFAFAVTFAGPKGVRLARGPP